MRTRRATAAGLTVTEVVVLVIIVAILVGTLLPAIGRYREEARRLRCRNNLNQLAKGMASYIPEHGYNDRWFPCPLGRTRDPNTYNGAEFPRSPTKTPR